MRMLGAATLLIAALLAAPGPARAAYDGSYVGECCFQTVEQGDVFSAYFELTNTGDQWWYPLGSSPNPVMLGTQSPENRSSPFFTSGDWLNAGRPTSADSGIVKPGGKGRFTFQATAPQTTGVYRESFRLVSEGIIWFGTPMYLDWTVVAAEPPTVAINGAPDKVLQGDPVKVAGTAKDNVSVQSVEWKLDGQSLGAPAKPASTAVDVTLPQAKLTAGSHTLTLTAKDPGGRTSATSTVFSVIPRPTSTTPAPTSGATTNSGSTPASTVRLAWTAPSFLLQSVRNRPGRVGVLRGLSVSLSSRSTLRVRCVRGCGGAARTLITVRPGSKSAQHMLGRALVLRRSTRLRVGLTAPGKVGVYRTFRFLVRQHIPVASRVGSGCLAAGAGLEAAPCPKAPAGSS